MVTTGPGAVTRRPRWRRLVLAGTPWVAAAALLVTGLALRTPATAPAAVPPSPEPTPAPVAPLPTAAQAAQAATPGLAPELELAVLATARAALGTAGLSLEGPAPDRWPLETRITAIEASGDGVTVVTVAALVIERRDGAWGAPATRAVAVPVRRTPPAVLGPAWPVSFPAVATTSPDGRALDDVDPGVVAALDTAGWLVDTVTAVALVGSHHLRVTLRGTPPGGAEAATHTVWLRDDPGGPTALPIPPTGASQSAGTDPDPTDDEEHP